MVNYKPSKTLMKGFTIFVYAGIGALIAFLAQLPPDQATPMIVAATGVLKMLENYVKHAGT